MQLILMDAYFMRKEYDKVMGAINAVDKMINKDPFLDYYRYLCYNVMVFRVILNAAPKLPCHPTVRSVASTP